MIYLLIKTGGKESKYPKYVQKFEKNFILTLVLAILIFLTLVILPLILGGAFNFGSVILGAVIAVLLTALMGFINYVPATKV